MTDQAPPAPEETPEKITDPAKIVEAYKLTLNEAHSMIMMIMSKLPIHHQIKQNALLFYDTGLMWARQGIDMIKFTVDEQKTTAEESPPEITH